MRVLVVEDVRRLADDIAEGLRDQGIAADVAYDGLDAASKVNINDYDVVVLDRDLPGLPGDVLCRMITEGDRPAMVLMLTASGTPGDRVSGLRLGADDSLSKPTAQPRVLRVGGLVLDPLNRTVVRDDRQLELSVKELALLEALMKASPVFLSAEDLLEQVWDENADPFTKTVQVTIGRLRRKLGDPPVIETVPGAGYRLR
jgi:DNA-binding response OmpR family regulator